MHERPSLLPFLLPISSNFLPFFFVPFHHFSSLPPSSYQEGGKCSMHAFRLRVNSPQYLSQLGRKKRTIGKLDRVSGAVSLILGFYHHLDLFFPLVPFRDTSLPLSSLFDLSSSRRVIFPLERIDNTRLQHTWNTKLLLLVVDTRRPALQKIASLISSSPPLR